MFLKELLMCCIIYIIIYKLMQLTNDIFDYFKEEEDE